MSRLLGQQLTTPIARFKVEMDTRDLANGIFASCQALVRRRGKEIIPSDEYKLYIYRAAQWLTDPRSKTGILFRGATGNGKTTLMDAIDCLLRFIFEKSYSTSDEPRFTSFRCEAKDIAMLVRTEEGQAYFRKICSHSFLCIDDFGDEPSEVISYGMVFNPIYDLLKYRYQRMLPTMITSNLTSDQIEKQYGIRMRDRLREMVVTVDFTNPSFRC